MRQWHFSAGFAAVAGSLFAALPPSAFAADEAVVADAGEQPIDLNFPENTPLSAVVTYVSDRLGINIVYDASLVSQPLTLRTPSTIPRDSLLDLLRSVLQARNLSLEETAVPRTLRIVQAQQLPEVARIAEAGAAGVVTDVFLLSHLAADRASTIVAPFLSKPGGNVAALSEEQMLVVTDYQETMEQVRQLIALLDVPRVESVVEVFDIQNADVNEVMRIVQPLLRPTVTGPRGVPPAISADPRTRQIFVAGTVKQVAEAGRLIARADRESTLVRIAYRPRVLTPERLDAMVQQVLRQKPTDTTYRSAPDKEAGVLMVTASPEVHEQIEGILSEVDIPGAQVQTPIRFYQLMNTVAKDVLETIRMLEANRGTNGGPAGAATTFYQFAEPAETQNLFADESSAPDDIPPAAPSGVVLGAAGASGRATVAMDTNTNSIIVVASPAQQVFYEQLIRQLDQRRPQVLLEVTVVTLDTSDGFVFGVELAAGGDAADGRILSFSAFGISELDPEEPSLTPSAAAGGTFALLSPDVADVVLQALATNTRSRLVSIPRVLVNDNQEASLQSQEQVPYQQTVVPEGEFVFSSAEYAEAGTNIIVTPHISEGDYLQLDYEVTLSNFTASPAALNLPPPKQENMVQSVVTVPDNHTIVVGGLNTSNFRESVSKVPLLGDIPLVKHLFRSTETNADNTTLFVFIRPQILRDDRFADLKQLSALDREAAGLDPGFPLSEPMLIRPDGVISSPADSQDPLMAPMP